MCSEVIRIKCVNWSKVLTTVLAHKTLAFIIP